MDDDNITPSPSPRRVGRVFAGLFLVCVGAVIALDQMGFPLPYWLFNWQNIPIVLGLFIGFRHGFRGGFWLILILIGLAFEFQDYYPRWELHRFILPGVLILVGIMFVLNPGRHHYDRWHDPRWQDKEWRAQWKHQWRLDREQWKNEWRNRKWKYKYQSGGDADPGTATGPGGTPGPGAYGPGTSNPGPAGATGTAGTNGPNGPTGTNGATGTATDPFTSSATTGAGYSRYSSEDYLDTTTFFGGIHKKIVSKSFKGGDVVTIMGGTELDFSQADISGRVKLDVVQIMGATKIIVPAHWEVRSDVTAIFAGFEDKRQQPTVNNPEKVLIIDGVSLFGGIELKNF